MSQMDPADFSSICSSILNKLKNLIRSLEIKHNRKLNILIKHQKARFVENDLNKNKNKIPIVNLSGVELTEYQKEVLSKGLNFSLSNKDLPVLDIVSSVELEIRDLSEDEKNDICCTINVELSKHKKIAANINKHENIALRELQRNNELIVRKADKGGGIVVLKKSDYQQKMLEVLESDEYVMLNKDPTSQIQRKIHKSLFKYKNWLTDKVRTRLTPHYSKVPHIYGLPKVHKEGVPL